MAALAGGALQLATSLPPVMASAPPRSGDNVVVQWDNALLDAVRVSAIGPPAVARALAVAHTCMYDAWAAFDPVAVGTRLGGTLRRPGNAQSASNKNRAISFAAYQAGVDLFPASKARFEAQMGSLGYDPADATTNTKSPAGIGTTACRAVLDFRHHDGSNQLGDLAPGPYSDYTGFQPMNAPMAVSGFDRASVRDPNRWQPLTFVGPKGNLVTQMAVGVQWGRVVPFALTSDSQFRSQTGPAKVDSAEYTQQAREVLALSANLTDEQKVIAEYWANGPRSELPPGHWALFAQYVSRRDGHGVDDDVKMFFAMTNALFDSSIVAWDNKGEGIYYPRVRGR